MIKIYKGDALEIMKKLYNDGVKVNAIIADIPFGTTQCKWDVVIPLDKMWEKIDKITSSNTPILIHGAEPFSSIVRMSNLSNYKYDWIWEKTSATNHLNAKRQPLRAYENIMVFYKIPCTYNPQKTKGHTKKSSKQKLGKTSNVYGANTQETSYSSTERYPRDVLKFKKDTQVSSLHDTQKPVALIEYFIKTYTNEGDLVLDFTMGSGTTMIACIKTNRRGIGIEIDEEIFNVAKNRILRHQGKVGLFA